MTLEIKGMALFPIDDAQLDETNDAQAEEEVSKYMAIHSISNIVKLIWRPKAEIHLVQNPNRSATKTTTCN